MQMLLPKVSQQRMLLLWWQRQQLPVHFRLSVSGRSSISASVSVSVGDRLIVRLQQLLPPAFLNETGCEVHQVLALTCSGLLAPQPSCFNCGYDYVVSTHVVTHIYVAFRHRAFNWLCVTGSYDNTKKFLTESVGAQKVLPRVTSDGASVGLLSAGHHPIEPIFEQLEMRILLESCAARSQGISRKILLAHKTV